MTEISLAGLEYFFYFDFLIHKKIVEMNVYQKITIQSVGELINAVTNIVTSSNMRFWYRGQENESWRLVPNVFRKPWPPEVLRETERDQMHTFRSRAGIRYERKPSFEDIASWISLMQHYGLPTRLLDWSRSPLVAAYFAIEKYLYQKTVEPIDACVWMLQPYSLNNWQNLEEITLTIDSGLCRPEIEPAFYHNSEETGKIRAVMSSELDLRMFVQQGAFTIHSTTEPLDAMPLPEGILRKFIIPAKVCTRFACELAIAGFRKGDIYPDLQSLAIDLSEFNPHI